MRILALLPSTPSCNISKFYSNSDSGFSLFCMEISFIAKPRSMIIFSVNVVTVVVFWAQFSAAVGTFFIKHSLPLQ